MLSIIRLRSEELAQHEVAYYFAALALGLIGGLLSAPSWLAAGLMAAVLLSIFVGDHPRVVGSGRTQEVLVDRAFTGERGDSCPSFVGAEAYDEPAYATRSAL